MGDSDQNPCGLGSLSTHIFSRWDYLSRWLECSFLGMLVRTQEFSRGKPESMVGRRMGWRGQAGAGKSEVLHFNKWHWRGTRISSLRLGAGFSTISSAEWGLPAYSNRGWTTEPEGNAQSREWLEHRHNPTAGKCGCPPVYYTWLSEMFRRVCQGERHFKSCF